MCNLYSIKTDLGGYFDALAAAADPANTLVVDKDYAAPGKPGFVVRQQGASRVLSTMRWGFPTRNPRKRPAREGELPFLYDWWTNARNMQSNMWKPWLLTVFAGIAEFERELIHQRTSSERGAAKARGVRFGRPPKLTPDQIASGERLVGEGTYVREAAKLFKCQHATLYRALSSSSTSSDW